MDLNQKKEIVQDLRDRFQKSKVLIVTDYKGLDVGAINDLRRKLREADIEFKVVKNTLLIRAAEDTDADLIKESFKGPIKIGVMDGQVLSIENIKALSSLPSREVLLAQVLSAMNAVPTTFVRTLDAIPASVVRVLAAIRDQKEAA